MSHKLYGKYRGTVLDNIDPLGQGRIIAEVPDALGLAPSTWAEACAPLAGVQSGVWLAPQIGAGVWIEFERGDPNFPIWSGCRWLSIADVPVLAQNGPAASPPIVLQTPGGAALALSDAPGLFGRHPLKDGGRRDDLDQRRRHRHRQRQGRRDHADRADGRGQQRRLDGDMI